MHRETDRLADIKRDRQTGQTGHRDRDRQRETQRDTERFSVSVPACVKLLIPAWQRKSV